MQTSTGLVQEIVLGADGLQAAWISCPPTSLPAPGQYLSAWSPMDPLAPLAATLFAGIIQEDRFLALSPLPASWQPGTRLALRGPLGHGFTLPVTARRVALAAFGQSCERLMPLAHLALQIEASVALFTDGWLPPLPAALEANPLSSLPEALSWADYLAVEADHTTLPQLRTKLNVPPGEHLPCPAQVLFRVDMPCAGLAVCGACWTPARRGLLYACSDGPVFTLDDLEW
ncbi:MAG TPA: hypothetical protein VN363_06585 [Anaerolineales bacterium]|nr:hypothetical protein [Anaerolineales bacterium]